MHRQSYEQKRKAGNILLPKSLVYKQLQVNTNAAQVFVQIPQMIWHKKKKQASRWVGHEYYFITLFKTL